MLSGQLPFPSNSIMTSLHKVLHTDPIHPSNLEEQGFVPDKWHQVFSTALNKNRDERYATAAEFASELFGVFPGFCPDEAAMEPPPPRPTATSGAPRRRPAEDTLTLWPQPASAKVRRVPEGIGITARALHSKKQSVEKKRSLPALIKTALGGRRHIALGAFGVTNTLAIITFGSMSRETEPVRPKPLSLSAFPAAPEVPAQPPPLVRGALSIQTDPSDAEISVNGKEYGWTPFELEDLTLGTYRIALEKTGYHRVEFATLLSVGSPQATLIVPLNRDLQQDTTATSSIRSESSPESPPTSEPDRGPVTIQAVVNFTGRQMLITNENSFNWTDVKLVDNSGYVLEVAVMEAGQAYTLEVGEEPRQISIWCNTPIGRGSRFFLVATENGHSSLPQ